MKAAPRQIPAEQLLAAVPYRNEAMELAPRGSGGLLATVPLRRPRWLVAPLTWILPFSSHRRIELDAAGAEVLNHCDGEHTIEEVIEAFARAHKLSFREAQLPVMQFLQQLTQRGMVAVVGGAEAQGEDAP